jgi:hypothetical protein
MVRRLTRIDAHEIQIARQSSVLKSIVEDEDLFSPPTEKLEPSLVTVGTNGHREPRNQSGQLHGLVPSLGGCGENGLPF